jgi:hypothetical protein
MQPRDQASRKGGDLPAVSTGKPSTPGQPCPGRTFETFDHVSVCALFLCQGMASLIRYAIWFNRIPFVLRSPTFGSPPVEMHVHCRARRRAALTLFSIKRCLRASSRSRALITCINDFRCSGLEIT